MNTATRRASFRAAITLGLLLALHHAQPNAQEYPATSVRVVISGPPGSLGDSLARLVFSQVAERLGHQFIVDSRPGAGGSLAAEVVAKAPPDGYTLLSTVNSVMAVNPLLSLKPTYDPLRDFEPVSTLARVSEVLVVNPSLGIKTLEEFVRQAKARPGQITYASAGNGHPTHLVMELLQQSAGVQLLHIPYKGASPAMQALVGGEVGALNVGIGLARPHIASGKVVALATTGFPSNKGLPGVPALASSLSATEYVPWIGVFAPMGTPKAIVDKLNAEIARSLALPEVKARLESLDLTVVGGSPAELFQTLRADIAVNRALVNSIGLKLD